MRLEQVPNQGDQAVPNEASAEQTQREIRNLHMEQERKRAMARLSGHSFETEKGSVYTYNQEGQTTRHKTATGEKLESQDITVFVDLNDAENQAFLDVIHSENPDKKKKIYIVERQGKVMISPGLSANFLMSSTLITSTWQFLKMES